MLSSAEQRFYSRQLSLPELGMAGQLRLKAARVLVIGAGGLGCPALQYLAAAGVGTLGIVDSDCVEISNLHRQVLFTEADTGLLKAEAAAARLAALNPHIRLIAHAVLLTRHNIEAILQEYDIVVDGSDNFPTRYLVSDACLLGGKILVFGSIYKFEGQLSVFNYRHGPTYRCLYPTPPHADEVPNCAETGVLGVLPGVIGSLLAAEVIKIITGLGDVLSGRVLLYDSLRTEFRSFTFAPQPASRQLTALQNDYGQACAITTAVLEEIDFYELETAMQELVQPLLVDVREPHEFLAYNLGGVNWPLATLQRHIPELLARTSVILCCESGVRSRKAHQLLASALPHHRFRQLKGGVGAARFR